MFPADDDGGVMSDENENAIRNVYIQTIQNLAKERDELKEKLAVAIGALEAIAHWKSDANVCCFPVNCYEVLDKIRGEK
jgi:hypothetical protein